MKIRLSKEVIAEYIDYNPLTGEFRWKKSAPPRGKVGAIAGKVTNNARPGCRHPHRRISIRGCEYPASHIAWLLMTGEWPKAPIIDHSNNNGDDNIWTNLRLATQTQNQMNTSIRCDNTSGYKGVHPYKRGKRSKWVAQIGRHHIGYFATAEEAAKAYDTEAIKLYGEFAYLNFPPIS